MSAEFFKVRNWEKHQHYKDRSPPWIKLYNNLLEHYEFSLLEDAQKFHLIAIFLLATRTNNKIRNDARWVQKKIDASEPVDLDALFKSGFIEPIPDPVQQPEHDASTMLASCTGDRIERREEESREEQSREEQREAEAPPPAAATGDEFPMPLDWRESESFGQLMKMAGLPPEVLNDASRAEFVSHWYSQPKTRHIQRKWDNVFLKSLTTSYRKNPAAAMGKQGGKSDGQQTAADRYQENRRKFEEQTDDPSCDYTPNF